MTQRDTDVGYEILPRKRTVYPRRNQEFLDLHTVIADFVLDPQTAPRFDATRRFFLQGSCLAAYLQDELQGLGRPAFFNSLVEAFNTPLAHLACFTGLQAGSPVHEALSNADTLVMTLGTAATWFDKASNAFVVAPDLNDVHRYYQRTPTVSEHAAILAHALDTVYALNAGVDIVFSVSAVPLGRTFEFDSAIVGDCHSKSNLRAAVHELIAGYPGKKPVYFPSFEMVRWVGAHSGRAYGDDGLPRHVSKAYVRQIVGSLLRRA